MISGLDSTLGTLLRQELPADLVGPEAATPVSISFAAPDGQFPPPSVTLPAIDLFLYDIRENWELRDPQWTVKRLDGDRVEKVPPPVRVDCSYLVTAWASEASPNPAEDEHRLLGEAMRALLRYRKLPEELLQGSLAGQEPPVRAAALQPAVLQSVGEFWQAMGGKPKAALNYTLTIAVDVLPSRVLPAVKERVIGMDHMEPATPTP